MKKAGETLLFLFCKGAGRGSIPARKIPQTSRAVREARPYNRHTTYILPYNREPTSLHS